MTQESMPPAANRTTKWLWMAGVAILVLVFLGTLFWQRPVTTQVFPGEIPVAQAASMRDKGSFLLDVRQPEEWSEGHIPGSTLIPLGELESRVGDVPRNREIVVVCRSGNRSKRGRDILLKAGFDRVTSMTGGLIAWKAERRPTISGL